MSQAEAFFSELYAGQSGILELRTFKHPDANALRKFIPVQEGAFDFTPVARFLKETEQRKIGAYFGVALRTQASLRTGEGDLAHCQSLTALFVDADYKRDTEAETRRKIAALPVPPSLMVSTGGGLHAYWLLSRPLLLKTAEGLTQARQLLESVASKADVADKSVSEPARVLRIPGTWNFKYTPPLPVVWEDAE